MKQKYLFLSSVALALLTPIFFVSAGWSSPTNTPPSGNASAPIHVGSASQTKEGLLGLDGLAVFGNAIFSGTLEATEICFDTDCRTEWPTGGEGGGGGSFSGGGTTGKIPKFISSTEIGNSLLSESGSTVTVGGNLSAENGSFSGTLSSGALTASSITSSGALTAESGTINGTLSTDALAVWGDSTLVGSLNVGPGSAPDGYSFTGALNVFGDQLSSGKIITFGPNNQFRKNVIIGEAGDVGAADTGLISYGPVDFYNTFNVRGQAVIENSVDGDRTNDTIFNDVYDGKNYLRGTTIIADNGGNVGIGTASPTEKLEVNGKVKATSLCIGSDCRTSWPTGGSGGSGGTVTGTGSNGKITRWSGTSGEVMDSQYLEEVAGGIEDSGYFTANTLSIWGNSYMAGNLGLGVVSPTEKLEVGGNLKVTGNSTVSGNSSVAGTLGVTGNSTFSGNTSVTGNSTISGNATITGVTSLTGNVGIGTASPGSRLHIKQPSGASRTEILVESLDAGGNVGASGAVFQGSDATWHLGNNIAGANDSSSTNFSLGAYFSGAWHENLLTLKTSGNLGVGSSNPTEKLYVAGNIKGTGSITGTSLCISTDCKTSWPASASGSGTTGALSKWTSSTGLGDSLVSESGTTVTVGGTLKVTGGSPGSNKVLISDSSGNASWSALTGIGGTTGTGTSGKIPKWSGTTGFADSLLSESGASVSVGAISSSASLVVHGALISSSVTTSDEATIGGNISSGARVNIGTNATESGNSILHFQNVGSSDAGIVRSSQSTGDTGNAPLLLQASTLQVDTADASANSILVSKDASGNTKWGGIYVNSTSVLGPNYSTTVSCNSGDIAISGGFKGDSGSDTHSAVDSIASYPSGGSSSSAPTGWSCTRRTAYDFTCYAVCLDTQ